MLKQEFSYCRSLKCVGLIALEKNNREITLSANKMTELFVTLMLTSFFFFLAHHILGYTADKKGWMSNI